MTTNIFNRLMTSLNRVTLQAAEQNGDNIKTITIGQFVSPEYQANYAQQIAQIRALCPTLEDKIKNEDRVKQLKVRLPAGIISGVAADGIGQDNIVERNGVISIDIDAKDNPDIHDWEALKRDLASLPFVAYAGISVSGLGVFALIPILDPMRHKEHFDSLDRYFTDYGLKLDRAPQNISSKRFVSYDPAPVWNTEAEVYEQLVEAPLNPLNPLNSLNSLNPLNPLNPLNSSNPSLEPRPGMLKQLLRSMVMPLCSSDFAPFDLEDFLHRHGIEYEARPRQGGTQYIVRCPWAHLHSSHSYADSALFRYPDGRIGYKCLHDHCADRTWHDFREYYETQ